MHENDLSEIIIKYALKIHKALGPGLLESVYEECLYFELDRNEIGVKRQWPVPVQYESISLNCGYRVDLLVDDKVIVELKSVDELRNIHKAQVLTYLKLSGLKLGLLMNFNSRYLRDGIKRVVNNL